MITIEVTQKIEAPVAQVSQVLLDHAQLDRFFNAKIILIKAQNNGELIGGKGAVRQISIGKIVFEEEIISASNEHICYRIIGNWPVSDHQGDIHLTSQLTPQVTSLDSSTTQLDYIIKFNGPKWLPSILLKFFVGRDINNAMKKLALHFVARSDSTGTCA
ncbi:SRPBCC family protein [Colwellia sp. 12G3]|uniref:SRPBCC family protein n=1 Tax=Colwellia sp. 12G3 TaxID=2058299 RepID=UPI001E4F07C9|nr:SRPBCC family protein [Colwellia sp. 12G3]